MTYWNSNEKKTVIAQLKQHLQCLSFIRETLWQGFTIIFIVDKMQKYLKKSKSFLITDFSTLCASRSLRSWNAPRPSVMLCNGLVSWPQPQRSRSPKRPPSWWRTVTHTYARTPSSYPCLPPRTPSGRRSSSAPSSDEPLHSGAGTASPGSSVFTTPGAPGCGHWVEFGRVDTVVGQLCPGGWGFWGESATKLATQWVCVVLLIN